MKVKKQVFMWDFTFKWKFSSKWESNYSRTKFQALVGDPQLLDPQEGDWSQLTLLALWKDFNK